MTSISGQQRISDAAADLSWRIYIVALTLGFFVSFEPAPTDLVFMVALGVFCFTRPAPTPFLSGTALTGVFLYCFFSVLSLVYVVYEPKVAFRAVAVEFYMIGLFVMTAYFTKARGDRGFFAILAAFAVGAFIASLVAAGALLDLFPNSEIFFRDESGIRVQATFKDPNVFGPYLIPGILFMFWMVIESPRYRAVYLAVLGLLLMSLISTYSRGAWVHAIISIATFSVALLIYRPTARITFTGIVVLIIIALVTVMLFLDQITARLSDTFLAQRLSLQSYDDSRFAHVADATQRIWEHPFGIGPGQARFKYGYLPHNTFVAFAMHNGILASLGLALIYGASMTRCAAKVLSQKPGWTKYAFILAALLGLLVLAQVVGAGHWRHLYIVCGLAFGTYRSDILLPPALFARRRSAEANHRKWRLARNAAQRDAEPT